MALTENGGMSPADFAAIDGGCNNFGGDGWWIVLLLLFANGGWGNFGGYGNDGVLPYFYNTQTQNDVNRGFDNAGLTSQLSGIQNAITDGFSTAEVSACNRAMTQMQQNFDNQMALQNCCCENRLANCQTQNVIQSEGSATRFADANNTRDIVENCNRNNQAILDKLCQLELDAKNEKIGDLERQLTMANLAASQTAQTAQLLADNTAQTVALEQYLNPSPIPAYVVQNPNCCPTNYGCGCGM